MMRTMRLVMAAAALAVVLQPATADAHGRLPRGRYNCYTSTGDYAYYAVRIDSRRAYAWSYNSGEAWTKGSYRHGSTRNISFRSGPLARVIVRRSQHYTFDGGDGIFLVYRWNDGTQAEYYCGNS